MLKLSINKTQLSTFDTVLFQGKVVMIEDEKEADAALENIKRIGIVGIDTETRPSFKKGVSYNVSLMQVSTLDKCYLFRLKKTGFTNSIKDFLENKDIIKIGLSLRDDIKMLHKLCEFEPSSFIDLQKFVKDYGIIDNSLQKIYGIIFEKKISKGQRLTNWEAAELTESQKRYAATDAWACLKIYNELIGNKFDSNNSPYIYIENEE